MPFRGTFDPERNIAGFDTLRNLADSVQHVVPGHDPEVMKRYPAASAALEGIVVRLDRPPTQ